jgi:hypothetical protein
MSKDFELLGGRIATEGAIYLHYALPDQKKLGTMVVRESNNKSFFDGLQKMTIVLLIHSVVRFVLLIVMVVGLARATIILVGEVASAKLDQTMATVFVRLFDLQALLGLLIIFLGGFGKPLHTLLMFIALVFAHWMQSIINQAQGEPARLLRIALYVVPLSIVLFSLALIGHLPV